MHAWRFFIVIAAAIAVVVAAAPRSHAQQAYPDKPVRVIVGFAAGSGSDIFARMYADKLSKRFNMRFVVENIVGNASNSAALAASQAQPDGYTLFFVTNANAIAVSLYKKLRYRFPDDFECISLLAKAAQVLVVNPALGFNSVKDIVAAARAKPGSVLNANGGVGGGSHLAAEMLSMMSDVRLLEVPYKSTNESLTDLIAGRVSMTFAIWPVVRSFINDGRLKALAVTSESRMTVAPNIPTIAETGVPGFEVVQWFGFMAPKGTPPEIVRTLADALGAIQNEDNIKKEIIDNGGELRTEARDDFRRFIESDIKQWGKAVAHAGVSID